jgi:hypothetical protein
LPPRCPRRSLSEFPNLFYLKQREASALRFDSPDCNGLGGVISEFSVYWLLLADQQIGLTVLTFQPDWQALPNACFCAFSVLRPAKIMGGSRSYPAPRP